MERLHCIYLPLSLPLPLCLYLSASTSLPLPLCLYLSASTSLPLPLCLCLCLPRNTQPTTTASTRFPSPSRSSSSNSSSKVKSRPSFLAPITLVFIYVYSIIRASLSAPRVSVRFKVKRIALTIKLLASTK
ncbi:hypothetical protein BKA65DRAFT_201039 [Rhexocercosporidium sp. MPI-PUGE-AT-0058]|nr:hypothetical protein BKA65DRAFT_201039 [Rhexocercosporidium sp. MPI-PUGE-AT-0058]